MDSKVEFEVRVELSNRTICTRMTGLLSESEMRAWAKQYCNAIDRFHGLKHMVIADMRGMKAVHPSMANIMGAAIAYARGHGAVLFAHVSDDTVQRLQARRVARQNSAVDDVTVDVASVEEAQRVVSEARGKVNDQSPRTSIRASM